MTSTRIARLPALVLAGSLAWASAPAQQPAPAAQPPTAPAAPEPRGRGLMPGARFDRSPMRGPMPGSMAGHGPEMHGFGHHEMEGGFHIGPMGMWWKNPGVVQRVGLSADQTKRMDDIFQQSRLQLVDLKANLEKQNLMLEPMLGANPVDQARTLAQIDKVAQARADLEKANARMLLGIRAVLTPDQWTKLQTHGRDMGQSGSNSPAAGPGGPGGPGATATPGFRGGRGNRGGTAVPQEAPGGEF